jgi:hypothetical protein
VEFATAGRVPDDILLPQPDGELIQHVGAADNAAIALIAVGVLALYVVERRVAAHVANRQALLPVRELSQLERDGNNGVAQPARCIDVQGAI